MSISNGRTKVQGEWKAQNCREKAGFVGSRRQLAGFRGQMCHLWRRVASPIGADRRSFLRTCGLLDLVL